MILGMFGLSPLPRLSSYARAIAGRKLQKASESVNSESLWTNANPPVVTGDFVAVDNITQEGHLITLSVDGIATIQTFGSTVRQSFFVDHYSRLLLDFSGNRKQYVNNVAPNGATQNLVFTVGVPVNQNLASFLSNPENDTLTITVSSGAPPQGTSITNGVLSGAPIVSGVGSFTLSTSDGIESGTCIVNWTVNSSSTGTTAGDLISDIRSKRLVGGGLVN